MVQKNLKVLLGCTGSGKTAWIEQHEPASVINCDSRQIYRHLDIGTAKPEPELLERVKHHLVDIKDINENFSAGEFIRTVNSILENEEPLISCGTPFYLNALVNGMDELPEVPEDIRSRVNAMEQDMGIEELYSILSSIDPQRAAQLKPADSQRIRRALEVYYATGSPISSFFTGNRQSDTDFNIMYIEKDRAELRNIITERTEHMLNRGMVNETEWAIGKFGRDTLLNKKIIGYKECVDYIEGRISREETKAGIITSTMQYAKRQETFFRKILRSPNVRIDRI